MWLFNLCSLTKGSGSVFDGLPIRAVLKLLVSSSLS